MIDFLGNSKNEIQKQFSNSNIALLIQKKSGVKQKYVGDTINRIIPDVINWKTCSDDALNRWGKILQMPRIYKLKDGSFYTVPTEEYRSFIGLAFFSTGWQGDTYSLNEALVQIYGDRGVVQILDNNDLQIIVYIFIKIPQEIDYILQNYDILPRVAGLKTIVVVRDKYYFATKPYDYNLPTNTTTGLNDYNDSNVKVQAGENVGILTYDNLEI